ncbi:GtrA family protein [Cellulosimicrobium sp. MI9406]|jgi:putative flippase GtrA|uniref:GtrA family protein n=1 Tax=Cellulosimicrobium sp. MI9406 TaxID=2931398 RepID=UPI00339E7CB3
MVMDPEPPTTGDAHAPRPPAGMQGTLGPLFKIVKDQRVAFLIVGGFNTFLGTAWFVAFELLFRGHLGAYGYMASLVCAHVAAVLCAFVLYRKFVFRVTGHVWLDLARFEVVNLAALAVNVVALPFVVELVGLSPIPAQLLITCVTALISYFGHKGFSFHRKQPASEPNPRVEETEA